jgi:NAD(P)-dependent dehydrogenase (short-subunit alcohol dehydrogenase family)
MAHGPGPSVNTDATGSARDPDPGPDVAWMATAQPLEGTVAVITGAGSGIGKAIAIRYAQAGADVALLGRRATKLSETSLEVESAGRRAMVIPVDVTDEPALVLALKSILQELGRCDSLVNAAGTTHRGPTEAVTPEAWNEVINTNLTGTFLACQVFGRHFLDAGRGSILNIASLASVLAAPGRTAYGASKAGVAQLTRQLAVEWADRGVRVNCLMPGFIRTPMLDSLLASGRVDAPRLLDRTPMRRFGETREIVGPAVFLAAPWASFITGTSLVVDGALSIYSHP